MEDSILKYDGGELWNYLIDNGICLCRINYYAGGGWQIVVEGKRGLLGGVPTIKYDIDRSRIIISLKKIFSSKLIDQIDLYTTTNKDELSRRIYDDLMKSGQSRLRQAK